MDDTLLLTRSRRLADIEILRALAVVMVLAEHVSFTLYAWNTRWYGVSVEYWRGAAGVDMFFAISGFVIARGLLPRLEACADTFGRVREIIVFLIRRFWRLQPLAVLWLVVPLGLTMSFNHSGAFHTMHANLPAAFSSLVAINNLRTAPLLGRHDVGLFFPYWSLSLEEQFYLLLPAVFLLLGKRLIWLLAGLVIYQFFIVPTQLSFLLRPGALSAGVLLALWERDRFYPLAEPTFLRSVAARLVFVGVMLFTLGALESELLQPVVSFKWGLVSLVATALVYAASFDRGYIVGRGLLYRVLVWLGERSYAIYLVHIPAYALVREAFWRWDPPPIYPSIWLDMKYLVPALALTAVLAEVSHRSIEVPLRRFGVRVATSIYHRRDPLASPIARSVER